jgi:hypothetical protein
MRQEKVEFPEQSDTALTAKLEVFLDQLRETTRGLEELLQQVKGGKRDG